MMPAGTVISGNPVRSVLRLILPGQVEKLRKRSRLTRIQGGEVAFELRLEFALSHWAEHVAPQGFKGFWQFDGDDLRTALAEGFLRSLKNRIHLRVRTLEITDYANGLALQRGTTQCRFELYFVCGKVEGRRVALVLALDRIEHDGLIQHAVGNDACGIERERQRNNAATADQPQRRSKTHRAGDAGRRADRAARVRPQREGSGAIHADSSRLLSRKCADAGALASGHKTPTTAHR